MQIKNGNKIPVCYINLNLCLTLLIILTLKYLQSKVNLIGLTGLACTRFTFVEEKIHKILLMNCKLKESIEVFAKLMCVDLLKFLLFNGRKLYLSTSKNL